MASKTAKNILVINCGSSSIKFQIIDPLTKIRRINGIAERLATPKAQLKIQEPNLPKTTLKLGSADHRTALDNIFEKLNENHKFAAIGHRVVHGGDYFKNSTIIDEKVKEKIKELFPLAPIHNPNNLMGINLLEQRFPELTQVAVFDTSFHVKSMPEKAFR